MFSHLLYTYCKTSHIALDIPLPNINIKLKKKTREKTNTNIKQKDLSFLETKIWSKIIPSSTILKLRLLSCMIEKHLLLHLQS